MELSPDTQRILLRKESKNIPDIGNGKHGAFILYRTSNTWAGETWARCVRLVNLNFTRNMKGLILCFYCMKFWLDPIFIVESIRTNGEAKLERDYSGETSKESTSIIQSPIIYCLDQVAGVKGQSQNPANQQDMVTDQPTKEDLVDDSTVWITHCPKSGRSRFNSTAMLCLTWPNECNLHKTLILPHSSFRHIAWSWRWKELSCLNLLSKFKVKYQG